MKCVAIPSTKLRERIPLREDKNGVFSLLNGCNKKVILAIQHYAPEVGEDIKPHYAFKKPLNSLVFWGYTMGNPLRSDCPLLSILTLF